MLLSRQPFKWIIFLLKINIVTQREMAGLIHLSSLHKVSVSTLLIKKKKKKSVSTLLKGAPEDILN